MDLSQSFHQRLNITPEKGEMRDGGIRYLMMRPDVLMGMFARLPDAARAEALTALTASVAENGGKSVKAYRDSGAVDPAAMMKTIADTSGELGWGVWSFETVSPERIDITVTNSPFADGIGHSDKPVCAPIKGMLTAIGPLLLNCDAVEAVEISCHAQTGKGPCRFTLKRSIS
ncbi:V4R domain-containing protein [Celeribacter sp. ULVN23_4]